MKVSERFFVLLKKRNLMAALICLAGVGTNFLLSFIVSLFDLPLYLDTMGTIIVSAMGGPLPGVLVGFVTNIIKIIYSPTSVYYGVINVLIAVAAAFFYKRGLMKKVIGVVGLVFVLTFIGGGVGCLIPWFIEGIPFDGESLSGIFFSTGIFNEFFSHFLSSLILDLPDKAITVVLSYFLLRIIPKKLNKYAGFEMWMQAPVSEEEKKIQRKSHVRVMSLQAKFLIVVGVSLVLVAVVGMAISIVVYRKTIIREHTRIAEGTAEIAAGVIDGDLVSEFLETKGTTTEYKETNLLLSKILSSSTDIEYLYVYQILEDGCHVVFDIDTESLEAEGIGEVINFDEGFMDVVHDLLKGKEIDPIITDDQFGYLLTAYKPVFDSNGRCVCYVGADVDMGQLAGMEKSFLMEMISVFMGFFIVLCVFIMWLSEYTLIMPIKTITRLLDVFSNTEATQDNLDGDVRKFRAADIRTGDEVEKLYGSVERMLLNQTEQFRSIRRLSESTAQMQDGLIITMADMVENRDSDTGAHIQKTAAYVKILVEGLKDKGYYAEKITPKFISDIVRSAPLHDVGKINIPDEVLNKPGKLTDEEYAIMKTHTTAGKIILEKAMNTVKGGNYLKEARNMAAYHHERWDGKGYPEGLHGEIIPLSARIMAVADVLDALTSPRVYKPAFTLEKALTIIEEGRGTQFDPKVVEVLMDSLPEVQVILRKYSREI